MHIRLNFLLVGRAWRSTTLWAFLVLTSVTVLTIQLVASEPALAKKRKKNYRATGPQVIARQPWPPAISPDYISTIKRNKLLIANKYGRLSVVDFNKVGKKGKEPKVLAEITGVGNKVEAISYSRPYAYMLLNKKSKPGSPKEVQLVKIGLKRIDEPSIVSSNSIEELKHGSIVLAQRKAVIIAGKSKANQNIILIIQAGKRKSGSPDSINVLSTITTKHPVKALAVDSRKLIALGTSDNQSQVSFINIASLTAPTLIKTIDMKGEYKTLAKRKTILVVGGKDKNGQCEARTIGLKPEPNVVAGATVNQLDSISGLVALNKEVLLSGSSRTGSKLLSLSMDKHGNLLTATEIKRSSPKRKRRSARSNLIYDGSQVYLSSGWAGIDTLKKKKDAWLTGYSYSIPRMGASNMASWGNSAVLVAGELVKYDLTDPNKPKIAEKVALSTPVKSMVGAGSYILCLTKDQIVLRKMDNLNLSVASQKVVGTSMAFDKDQHRAYVIKGFGKLTRIFPFKVYSDSLDGQASLDIPGNYTKIRVKNGKMLLADLHEISLFNVGSEVKRTGNRKFENYAIRDAWLLDDYILATTIDQSSKGFLLVLSAKDEGLNIVGNTPLPHNARALAALGNSVVTIGRNDKGKDMLTLVDINNPSQPEQKDSVETIEAAASVSLKPGVTLVAGRGLEILSNNSTP